MKSSTKAQSATSLPRAPRDEVSSRSARYLIMMGVRVLCFILMVVVQPFGWYTWLFAAGAIFLPYIAVVLANVGQEGNGPVAESPERALPAPSAAPTPAPQTDPGVIRIAETGTTGAGAAGPASKSATETPPSKPATASAAERPTSSDPRDAAS